MTDEIVYYHGSVKLYLQGRKALEIRKQSPDHYSYYLGSKQSGIQVRDFRQDVCYAAQRAIEGDELNEFADIFNQPADVKINMNKEQIRIDICNNLEGDAVPTLWLGVVKDGDKLPLTYVDWEVYRALDNARTGFVALVPG